MAAPSEFFDPAAAADYAERVARHVPGLRDLHRMARLLLAEHVPSPGSVLVLGAGGGLELDAFAAARPDWRFLAIDPSAEMLRQAQIRLGDRAGQADFYEGYIDEAPHGPYDGAVCLLTLHFLPEAARIRTAREVWRRLTPGAPFVVAHHSFPTDGPAADRWLDRNLALVVDAGAPRDRAERNLAAMKTRLPVLSPERDEAVLRAAGFADVELFYAAFTFKGWVCRKPARP